MPIAMYPGSFDPVTRGHLDIIKRSSRMFDKVIVAVLVNSAKTPLFTVEERVSMLREACKNIPNVEIDSFNGLTVTFAKQKGATVMVRGLRAVTDFENEIQLAHTNFAMMPEIETVFLATAITTGRMFPALCPATLSVRSLPSARQGSCKTAFKPRFPSA